MSRDTHYCTLNKYGRRDRGVSRYSILTIFGRRGTVYTIYQRTIEIGLLEIYLNVALNYVPEDDSAIGVDVVQHYDSSPRSRSSQRQHKLQEIYVFTCVWLHV